MKVCKSVAPSKRSGRPKSGSYKVIPYLNGWFLVSDARTSHIHAAEPMYEPENNYVKIKTLKKIINFYPACDTFIHDVNSSSLQ